MASTQSPTHRRSARLAFDEDESRPTKKAKTSKDALSGYTKQPNGMKAVGKKNKAAYDEDADGFTFARTKSRSKPKNESAPDSKAASNEPTKPATGRRRKTLSDDTPTDDATAPKRRRSKRISADKERLESTTAPSRDENDATQPTDRARTPGGDEITAKGPTKIALPFADTPVIVRNKELRKISAQGHRRSSSGIRGRRASSLIDSGTSNGESGEEDFEKAKELRTDIYPQAMPHSEVATPEFYKHISQDLPEPRRMQQLLSWCATRALPEKPSGTSEDVNAALAARVIQEELLKDFSKKSEMSDWFNREDIAPAALIKKPNPRNMQNAAKLQELEREAERLEEEKQAWDKVLASLASSTHQDLSPAAAALSSAPEAINSALLDSPEQVSILSVILEQQKGLSDTTSTRLQRTTESLELKIDSLADGVHKFEKLKEAADGIVDGILENAAEALERRDRAQLEKVGMEKVGIGDLLRSLSRAG